jgi:uncharacterized protein involved in exopolysaccharide biosynthesis
VILSFAVVPLTLSWPRWMLAFTLGFFLAAFLGGGLAVAP